MEINHNNIKYYNPDSQGYTMAESQKQSQNRRSGKNNFDENGEDGENDLIYGNNYQGGRKRGQNRQPEGQMF